MGKSMKTPILETSRLWLRPLKEEDAPGAFLWTGDPKVSWYMRYETHESLEDTKQWLREGEKQLDSDLLYDFGFHKKDNDELIGSGGLTFNQQQGIWELGCNLRRDCWNQGYGTEAAAAILSFAENTLHIHRVMARHAKDNTASGRVLEKNGFSFVRECWDQKWSGSHRFECREYIWKSEKEEEKNSAARNEVDAAGGEVVMIVMAVGSLVAGVAYGISHVGFGAIDALVAHSDWILTALMFFVGISVGGSKGLVGKVKEYHVRVLIIPAGIIVGSIAGGLVAAFLCGFSLPTGAAIASGLGWYSLSGVMLTGIAGAQIGSITFLSNLLRELISFFTIPWIAKHLNYPTCIAPAGATSEDTTLPMMIRCTNGETVVLSVVNGVICSAFVPVLIEFFHAFM